MGTAIRFREHVCFAAARLYTSQAIQVTPDGRQWRQRRRWWILRGRRGIKSRVWRPSTQSTRCRGPRFGSLAFIVGECAAVCCCHCWQRYSCTTSSCICCQFFWHGTALHTSEHDRQREQRCTVFDDRDESAELRSSLFFLAQCSACSFRCLCRHCAAFDCAADAGFEAATVPASESAALPPSATVVSPDAIAHVWPIATAASVNGSAAESGAAS